MYQAYRNYARQLGLHYFRYIAENGLTTEQGTKVDVKLVTNLIKEAVNKVRIQPTCLNRVKDTTKNIYSDHPYF